MFLVALHTNIFELLLMNQSSFVHVICHHMLLTNHSISTMNIQLLDTNLYKRKNVFFKLKLSFLMNSMLNYSIFFMNKNIFIYWADQGEVFRRNHLIQLAELIKQKKYYYFSKERQISIVIFIQSNLLF